jgi:hypothetical protein
MDVSFRMGSGELCASGHRAEEVADMGLGDDNNHIDSISKYNIQCIQYYKMKRLLYIMHLEHVYCFILNEISLSSFSPGGPSMDGNASIRAQVWTNLINSRIYVVIIQNWRKRKASSNSFSLCHFVLNVPSQSAVRFAASM